MTKHNAVRSMRVASRMRRREMLVEAFIMRYEFTLTVLVAGLLALLLLWVIVYQIIQACV